MVLGAGGVAAIRRHRWGLQGPGGVRGSRRPSGQELALTARRPRTAVDKQMLSARAANFPRPIRLAVLGPEAARGQSGLAESVSACILNPIGHDLCGLHYYKMTW